MSSLQSRVVISANIVLLLLLLSVRGVLAQPSAPADAAASGASATGASSAEQAKSSPKPQTPTPASASTGRTDVLAQFNGALEDLAAKVSPAVVQILVTGFGPLEEHQHSDTALIVRQHAVGSGVIVDSDGYIMTNAHVVEGAQRIQVALPLPDGDSSGRVPEGRRRILEAHLIGSHKATDLALLKVDQKGLPTLPLLANERPRVGQLVFAIGSPEGLQNSVTMGVISALARQPDPTKAMAYIQTDAPINPGNSGGPLVDMNGEVVGLNTFILSEGGGSEGLGFAIPARVVDFVYKSLRKYGHVHRVEIGAGAQAISPTLAEALHLQQSWGVIIDDVKPNGPAASAGVKIQDIVVAADDRRVDTLPSLSAALYLHPLDQLLKLEVLRGSEHKIFYIPAVEHHDKMDQLLDSANPEQSLISRLGILAVDLTGDLHSITEDLRIPSGVLVVGRTADLILPESGLQAGDVIHELNQTPIDSMATLRAAVHALKPGDPVAIQVEREGGFLYLSFEMD